MPDFMVYFTLTGHGHGVIEADSLEEAEEKAKDFDVIPGTDECLEWSFDEITGIEET